MRESFASPNGSEPSQPNHVHACQPSGMANLSFMFRDKEAWRTCVSTCMLTEGCFACTLSQMVVVQGRALISSGLRDRFSERDFIFRSRVIYVFGNVQQCHHSVHGDFELACVSPATIS